MEAVTDDPAAPRTAPHRAAPFSFLPTVAALRSSIAHVGLALRDPEEFAARRHRGEVDYEPIVWAALAATAALGTTVYGMTMGLGEGYRTVCTKAGLFTFSAGLAWAIPLPALYILNSFAGSRLKPGTTLLAALVTTSWGGLAMVASVPIYWLFRVAVPDLPFLTPGLAKSLIVGVNLLIFTGVGVAMVDVFYRVLSRLEPDRERAPLWYLLLVFLIGGQLFYVLDLFQL